MHELRQLQLEPRATALTAHLEETLGADVRQLCFLDFDAINGGAEMTDGGQLSGFFFHRGASSVLVM